jgi:hypothetical protein
MARLDASLISVEMIETLAAGAEYPPDRHAAVQALLDVPAVSDAERAACHARFEL